MKTNKKKQFEALKVLKPDFQQFTIIDAILEDQINEEAYNETDKIKETEKIENRKIFF